MEIEGAECGREAGASAVDIVELRKILLPDVGHQIVRRWTWGGELRADLENVLMEEEHFGCEAMEMSFWGGGEKVEG
jgi:hypothetical protein